MKYIIKFVSIILLFFSVSPIYSWGQVPVSPTRGLTPQARSMQRYGDIPVSPYTGTPSVNITIDTLQSGKLSLPISLSYHSGGIKTEEHPGWVGLGWTLLAGGCITREKHNLDDEFLNNYSSEKGFMHHNTIPTDDYIIANGISSETRMLLFLHDTQPDIFHFNFLDYSGFFVLGNESEAAKQWHVYCSTPLKVIAHDEKYVPLINGHQANNNSKIISGFSIFTPDGIEYVFGGDKYSENDAIDYSIDITRQDTAPMVATAWHLTKIIHPNGDSFTLDYEHGNFIANLSFNYYLEYLSRNGANVSQGGKHFGGELVYPSYLKSIIGENLHVDFSTNNSTELTYSDNDYMRCVSNNETIFDHNPMIYLKDISLFTENDTTLFRKIKWEKLTNIYISDIGNNLLKRIDFKYNDNSQERLVLEELRFYGEGYETSDIYKFRYKDLDKLPPYLHNQHDHWGYPASSEEDALYYTKTTERDSNPAMADYGSLHEITYPTGGRTIFDFEPNTYTSQLPLDGFGICETTPLLFAGGMRIKRITNIPADGTMPETKEFYYVTGYTPSLTDTICCGILESHPTYVRHINIDNADYYVWSSESLGPTVNSLGHHVCYPEVVTKYSNGSYSIQKFTSLLDANYRNEAPSLYSLSISSPFITKAHYRGFLKTEKKYSNEGVLQCETNITYSSPNNVESYTHGFDYQEHSIRSGIEPGTPSSDFPIVSYSSYKIYTHKLLEASKQIKTYDGSNFCEQTTNYLYNPLGQIINRTTYYPSISGPQIEQDCFGYEWEDNNNLSFMENFLLSYPSVIEHYRNNNLVERNLFTYSIDGKLPLLSEVKRQKTQNEIWQIYKCNLWDKKGNPVYCIQNRKTPIVYLWGWDYTTPVAEIIGATEEDVTGVLGFQPQFAPYHAYEIKRKIHQLRTALPNAQVNSFTYLPHFGITSIQGADEVTKYYNYDLNHNLKSIKNYENSLLTEYSYSKAMNVDNGNLQGPLVSQLNILQNYTNIIGPAYIDSDSTIYYWLDRDLNFARPEWTLTGDIDKFTMDYDENFVYLHHKANSTSGTVTLNAIFRDEKGNYLYTKTHSIHSGTKHINTEMQVLEPQNTDTANIRIFIFENNQPISDFTGYTLTINGQPYIIYSYTGKSFFYATFRRNLKKDFYQITISHNGYQTTQSFTTSQLFLEPSN